MRRRLLVLGAGGLLGCGDAAEPPQRWPAPMAIDPAGRAQALTVPAGRFALVHVWARWCAPCRRELPMLQRLAPRLDARGLGLRLLALDDDPFALREYLAGLAFTLPVWRALTAPPALALPALPLTLLVDPQGWIARRHLGAQDWDAPERWLPASAWRAA